MTQICIREDYCKGCGLCIELCPSGVLDRSSRVNLRGYNPPVPTRVDSCTGCRICELTCPDLAIFIKAN